METVYSEAAPSKAVGMLLMTPPMVVVIPPMVLVISPMVLVTPLAIVPASDTPGNDALGVMVADVVVVSDEVDMAVVVAKTVGVGLTGMTFVVVFAEPVGAFGVVLAEPVDAVVTLVAFAEIGAAAAIADKDSEASERADEAADGVA